VIDALGCGGFLLDRKGRVLFLNEMARRCVGNGLALRRERLTATDHESDARLQHLFELARVSSGDQSAIMSVGLQRGCRRPLLVRILRLTEDARPALSSGTLLIVVLDPELYPEPSPDVLSQAFELTPTEATVAASIIGGRSPAEISGDLGVKAGTIRTHLKSVFLKTCTRRQTELVGLLTRVAFVIPHRVRPAAVMQVSEAASNGNLCSDATGSHNQESCSQLGRRQSRKDHMEP
jgi:DNA-binding CsgD family transcriptional regulator